MRLLVQDAGADQRVKQLLNLFRTTEMEGPININSGTGPPLHHVKNIVSDHGRHRRISYHCRGCLCRLGIRGRIRQVHRQAECLMQPTSDGDQTFPAQRVCPRLGGRTHHGIQLYPVSPHVSDGRQQSRNILRLIVHAPHQQYFQPNLSRKVLGKTLQAVNNRTQF